MEQNRTGDGSTFVPYLTKVWSVLWRTLVVIVALSFVLAALTGIAWGLDKFDVVKRCLDSLAPFSGFLTWLLAILLVGYGLQYEGIRNSISALIDRLQELPGGIRFGECARIRDKDIAMITERVVARIKGGEKEESNVLASQTYDSIRERIAIEEDIRRNGGTLNVPQSYAALQLQCFDGCFRCGDEIVFVETRQWKNMVAKRQNLIGVVSIFDDLKKRLSKWRRDRISLHVLICADMKDPVPKSESNSRYMTGIRTDVKVLLCRFNRNSVVEMVDLPQ